MLPDTNLEGKTALITGGTRGIGGAIADLFAEAGARVLITGTKQEDVRRRVKELSARGTAKPDGWAVDMTDAASFSSFRMRVRSLDSIHVLVNNAGNNKLAPIDEVEAEDLDLITSLNLRAPILLMRDVAPAMKRQGWGRIVNIASIWSVITKPGRAMYTASKFGLVGATKSAAVDLGEHNVLVNAVSPGFTLTELTERTLTPQDQERLSSSLPLRRFAQPEEIARTVLFLASDWNTYITGQNLVVDGGFVSV
jgi:3-oxoacyl-[acyl-carrier protein] reductase